MCVVKEKIMRDEKETDLIITGTDQGQIRIYDYLANSTLEQSTFNQIRVNHKSVIKLLYFKQKENGFLFSLGKEGNVFLMYLHTNQKTSYKK